MHSTYKEWLDNNCPKVFCHCGCNEELIVSKWWKHDGIPQYIRGHNPPWNKGLITAIHKSYKKWLEDNCPKIICSCGCSKEIVIQKHHIYQGIPKYISGHNNKFKKGHHTSTEFKKGKEHPNFNNWASKGEYCEKWDEPLRESIRNEFDRKCYFCGKEEKDNITKNGKIRKLSVHHIDADKEQGCNDKKWKLIPVCMNCHGKIHSHRIIKGN